MSNPLGARKQDKLMAMCLFPSINYTPVKYVLPLPYPVWRMLENSVNTAATSRLNENDVYLLDQTVQPDCFGDFLGQGKGVKSKTVSDEVKPTSSSDSIIVEGKYLIRKGDECTLNDANTFGKYTSPPSPAQIAHVALGILSFVPVVGSVAALADAALYTAEGDYVNAGLAAASAIPGGKIATTLGKGAMKLKGLAASVKLVGGGGRLGQAFTKGGAWVKGFTRRLKCGRCTFSTSWNVGTSAIEVGVAINSIYGAPVHAMRGAKILMDDEDLDYQGSGYLPFYLQRLYNSQNDNIGWFGQGWTAQGFEQRLEIEAQQDYIYLVDNSGRRVPFTYLTAGQSCYNPFEDITLYRLPHSDADQALTIHSQLIEADAVRGSRIGPKEPLRFVLFEGKHTPKAADYSDYEGIAQHFNHISLLNSRGTKATVQPSKQMDRYGHTLQLHYSHHAHSQFAHLPQYITDESDACYRLNFEWINEQPRITQLEKIADSDKDPISLATYTYDTAGDLIKVHRYGHLIRQFGYTDHLITWQQLPTGLEGRYLYDQMDSPKTARVITHTLSNGQHYQFEYIDAIDSDTKDSDTKDSPNSPNASLNHSIVIEQPESDYERTHHYYFDDWYNLKQYTNPLGHTTTLSYDHLDRVIKVQDPKGGHSKYQYHGTNLGTISTKVGVNPITGLDEYRTVRYQYDDKQLIAIQNPLGHTERLTYNEKGEMASYTDSEGHTTTYTYDKHGNLIQHTLANGSHFNYHYNEAGDLTQQTDCGGHRTTYLYDERQRLATLINAKDDKTTYHYNDSKPWLENLIEHIDYPDGSHIHLTHDDVGRLIRHTDAKDQSTQFAYHQDNLPIKRIDALGHSLNYEYDPLRRLSTLINENGEHWHFKYDKGDNLISETRFDAHQSHYRYDALGELSVQIDNPQLARHKQRHIHYQRDLIGQLIAKHAIHYPQHIGAQATSGAIKSTKPEYQRTRFTYDNAGQLISAANGNSRVALNYDRVGQLISETVTHHHRSKGDHQQHRQTLTHRYDDIGNRLKTTLPDGNILNQLYYGSGHLYNQSITSTDGTITEIRHSERNELHQETLRQQGELTSAFGYDTMGRLTKQYSSDHNQGRIIVQRAYNYDVLGQLTHLSGQTQLSGQVTGRTTTASTNPLFQRNHQYRYDKISRLTEHKLTDYHNQTGITEHFAFDPASNRVPVSTAVNDDKAPETTNPHKSGRPTKLTTHDKCITYTYDSHGRVLYKTQTPLGKDGKPLKQSANGVAGYRESLQLAYNANHELTHSITITQTGLNITEVIATYQYDAFGRRITKHSQTKNKTRLIKSATVKIVDNPIQPQKTQHKHTSYLWDGNRQLQETTDTHVFTTIYEQDSFAPVARLVWLQEGLTKAANDEPEDEKFYGDETPKLTSNLQIYHYHNDHLGTPNELTDSQGEVIWLADYEAWGNTAKVVWHEQKLEQLQVAKEDLQPLRFQGQYYDEETGLHYNRFRYFDPDMGMFTTRDPVGLMGGSNVFQYAPNPIGWIDPWGLTPEYYSLDSLGRPTGGFAEVTNSTIGTGTDALNSIHPPGWQGGGHPHHQQRGHLIANHHGGSGSEPKNLVTITDGTNHPGMTKHESRVTRHVKSGNTVLIEVKPNYVGNNLIPDSISMYAIDQNGNVVVDSTVKNGKRQRTKCCL